MNAKQVFWVLMLLGLSVVPGCDENKKKGKGTCGNGVLDPGEACDPALVVEETCADHGYHGGDAKPHCGTDCNLDFSICGGRCGDGNIDTPHGEECDGSNLGDHTCTSLGQGGGVLRCSEDCRRDFSGCRNICGNGVLEAQETCDDLNKIDGDGCSAECQVETGWECFGTPSICLPVCGDGIVVGDEECDGEPAGETDCRVFGYHAGEVLCSDQCRATFSECESFGSCGDGILQTDFEECDQDDFVDPGCRSLGFFTGGLVCSETCVIESVPCRNAVAIAAGYFHGCAILDDGTLRCWGRNSAGQIGIGVITSRSTPAQVLGLSAATVAVSGGYGHTCAVLHDGTVWCWGSNTHGQLGDGTTTQRALPVAVPGISGCVDVGAGDEHTCALCEGGRVWCWGRNTWGMLGDGTLDSSLVPVEVAHPEQAESLSVGVNHSCVLYPGGNVWCWGRNGKGQLGQGNTTNSSLPVQVPGLTGIVQVSSGYERTCAAGLDGSVWCWGDNTSGALGAGAGQATQTLPVQAQTSNALEVRTGYHHTCVLWINGNVHCWGSNSTGQLGDGTVQNRLLPDDTIITSGVQLYLAGDFSCALTVDGLVRCWGDNYYGQVTGESPWTSRLLPAEVVP